jgi:nitrite reductase (cytochrome c-552)
MCPYAEGASYFSTNPAACAAHAAPAQRRFELWSQGVHARSGVACADCNMPYVREGAMKVSDHWVRGPLLNVSRACQVCHPYDEAEPPR